MRIKSTPGGIFAIGDGEDSSFNDFSKNANNDLERSKNLLPKVRKDILACEEKLKDMPAYSEYNLKGTYGGRSFYIIKNNEVQEYGKILDQILTRFYSYLEKELNNSGNKDLQLLEASITLRKEVVKKAILDKIRDHQMDKLVHEYNNGKNKYKCAPMTIANINRGEETYVSHIFNPDADMNVVSRVGGSDGGGESIRNICISKDVFLPLNGKSCKENNYLLKLMGCKTSEELVNVLKNGGVGLSEEGKKIVSLSSTIKRAIETN